MIKDFERVAIVSAIGDIGYTELLDRVNQFASYTCKQKGCKTIIFSENRPGWIYAFFAVWQNEGIVVPVDASSTPSDVAYILRDCTPDGIWTSRGCEAVAREAMASTGREIPIQLIDDFEQVQVAPRGDAGLQLDDNRFCLDNHDTALIIYTSGTTGSPKGVMLSYANLYANMVSVSRDVPIFNKQRRTLILLPLHHVLPLVGTVIVPIICGGGVAICPSMSGPDIMQTLARGEVAIFVGVPRLWQMLYAGIKKKIDASALTRGLFWFCKTMNSPRLSRVIFSTVHKKLGGHLAYCVSGGAALDKEIGEGLRTLGLTMLEGYGMTETAPIISFTRPGDIIPGCVGLPLSTEEVKIIDGEICVKGPNVMLGYYNRPEETSQVIDKDGFVHTGDLGFLDELGRIHITGRSKEIIVLSNGKNVQPSEIEYKLERYDQLIKEAAIVQDGDMLRAIIVPQEAWAEHLSDAEVEEALKRQVLEPYNRTVTNYKKLMSIFVYRGDLPRTKLDKLQRFKLKALLTCENKKVDTPTTNLEEVQLPEYKILKTYIESEKKVDVHPHDHLETDLAFDSLDGVGLQGFIETTFGVEIKADTLVQYKHVLALAEHIAKAKTKMEVENIDWTRMIASETSQQVIPTTSTCFTAYAASLRCFLKTYNHLKIEGIEHLPIHGPYILAPNHQSYLDGAIALAGLRGESLKNAHFYATEEHVRGAFRKYMARTNNVVLMERGDLKNSILRLAEVLKRGKNLVIFPEGSRTRDGKLQPFKKTFAILSAELQIPIVPVCISGAYEAMPRGKRFPNSHPIKVQYLSPIIPNKEEAYDAVTSRVQSAIQEALSKC